MNEEEEGYTSRVYEQQLEEQQSIENEEEKKEFEVSTSITDLSETIDNDSMKKIVVNGGDTDVVENKQEEKTTAEEDEEEASLRLDTDMEMEKEIKEEEQTQRSIVFEELDKPSSISVEDVDEDAVPSSNVPSSSSMIDEHVTSILLAEEDAPIDASSNVLQHDVPFIEKVPSLIVAEDAALDKITSNVPSSIVAEHSPSSVSQDKLPNEHSVDLPSEDAAFDEESASINTKEAAFLIVAEHAHSSVIETDNDSAVDAESAPSFMDIKDEPSIVTEQIALNNPTKDVTEDVDFKDESSIDAPSAMDTADVTHVVAEDPPHVVDEKATSVVAANEPKTEAEETPLLNISEETKPIATEDLPPIVVKEPPLFLAEDAPAIVPGDASSMVDDDATKMVDKDASHMVDEDASKMIDDDASHMVDKNATKIAEGTSHMVDEDATKVIAEGTSHMDDGNGTKMIDEDDSSMVDEDASLVEGHENASPVPADEVSLASEVDTEMEMETELVEKGSSDKKRKRGRPARIQAKSQAKTPQSKREEEEDVCFICFDGGSLVLCDRRGCPKAYHPTCVNRDEAFFRSKGRWNCGWHICSNCEKPAHYMCYTCTYSLCKGCIKEAEFFCVRGKRGFCETCMRTVMLIEKNEQAQVDFDDKSSWEYLFKEYWIDLKGKLSLSLEELTQAKNPLKGSITSVQKGESSEDLYDANDDKGGSDSDGSSGHNEVNNSKRKKVKRQSKSFKEEGSHAVGEGMSRSNDVEWASKELLEFVAHMKNGDKSVLSQFDVQALLLEYIKLNNLRDPRRKSQIVCDTRLVNLFGKARVGHFEMLKLLESHFFLKEDTHADDIQGATADPEANQLDGDGSSTKASSDKRRKSRKKGDGKGRQTNLDDYAAIDVHNIKLLYLRRSLMEDLLEDSDNFHDKVVGSFVRIRISGSGQKQDMYRLVQIIGTQKAAEPYKIGKRSADVVLEILNLSKTEVIAMDIISNQEFSEDECKRLRQSIKCGLISRMTVGEVQEKAVSLQAVRVNDWLETEKLRISHLRDRASEQVILDHYFTLRECVEKLQLLNTKEERTRRLEEIPEVHADPNMDPNYESEEDEEQDDRPQDKSMISRDVSFSRKGRDPISPGKGSPASVDSWSGARKRVTSALDPGRNTSTIGTWDRGYATNGAGESVSDANHLNSWVKPKNLPSATGLSTGAPTGQAVGRSGPLHGISQESVTPAPTVISSNINETDKMWHYQDPSKKTQGPFSMVQLRKWNSSGHFPIDLRIWRTTERQEDAILLTDALAGNYCKEHPQRANNYSQPEKAVAAPENNPEVKWGVSWEGNTNMAWADKNRIDKTSVSNLKDAGGFANGGTTQSVNSDGWGSGPSTWAVPATNFKGDQSGHPLRGGWDSAKGNNAWAGRAVPSPHLSSSYSGQQQRPTSHHGGRSGGRWNHAQNQGNNWHSNRYGGSGRGYDQRTNNMGPSGQSSGDNWRTPQDNSTKSWNTFETPTSATEGWGLNQGNRTNWSSLPSPTPQSSRANWTDQASENQWSPTSSFSSYPANTNSATAPRTGSNAQQHSPIGMPGPNQAASGWAQQQQFSVAPQTGGWGPNSGSASLARPAEMLNQDYGNPPTPTPMSASDYIHP
ncbi:Zinc finger ccch domain-containing protein [Thalictrum thalictroides]|uniref:Zinc finger ccch domain-containing protein n=1 Tax=Thalictrum thalictroides TaxID=46969 RepID=A0A7J6V030_THATH|nr:Zinc finger ccch domain-containing protein [Thalictrum thalictroides]